MSLAERRPTSNPYAKGCGISKILDRIDPDDAETLRLWLADPARYPGQWIAEQLADEFGEHVRAATVQRHRHGKCCVS